MSPEEKLAITYEPRNNALVIVMATKGKLKKSLQLIRQHVEDMTEDMRNPATDFARDDPEGVAWLRDVWIPWWRRSTTALCREVAMRVSRGQMRIGALQAVEVAQALVDMPLEPCDGHGPVPCKVRVTSHDHGPIVDIVPEDDELVEKLGVDGAWPEDVEGEDL